MARPRNAERAAIAERRTRVLAMRVEQRPYTEIAAALGISETLARTDYVRAMECRKTELDEQRHLTVARELATLEIAEQAAWEVLRREHIVIQHGQVVRVNRRPVADDAPVLQAIDRILKISERRARLLGLDAPVRAKVEVTDAVDADIERLVAELAGLAAGGEAAPAGPPGAGSEQAPPA
jgi:uncharacterized protein (DUF3084 family)